MKWLGEPWFAILAIGAGAMVIMFLIVVPDARRVSIKRRRPFGSGKSSLNRASTVATEQIERLFASRVQPLTEKLELAGIKMKASEYMVIIGAAMFVGMALGVIARSFLLVLLLLALPPLIGYLALPIMAARRRSAFANQLDETAQMIAGGLRAGYSFNQAMSTVAKEADQPTAEEFSRVVNELRLGRPFDEAMLVAADRMKNEDFMWIVQAVSINREVGGNLAEVLDDVSKTIRERAELRRQVLTLSAEGRLSAVVLLGLPFGVAIFIGLTNPTYLGVLVSSLMGMMMLGAGAVMMLIGALWLRSIIRIKY